LKRKIRGGIKCVIQHGLPYTVKLFVKKVLVRLHLWNVFINFMHLFYKQIPSGDFITHRFFLLIKFNTLRRLRPSELFSISDKQYDYFKCEINKLNKKISAIENYFKAEINKLHKKNSAIEN
jgi:hypothetical protein